MKKYNSVIKFSSILIMTTCFLSCRPSESNTETQSSNHNNQSSSSEAEDRKENIKASPTPTPVSLVVQYIAGDDVNIRSAPSSSSKVLFKLGYGTEVKISGKTQADQSHKWKEVYFNDEPGWVAEQFLTSNVVENQVLAFEGCVIINAKKYCLNDNLAKIGFDTKPYYGLSGQELYSKVSSGLNDFDKFDDIGVDFSYKRLDDLSIDNSISGENLTIREITIRKIFSGKINPDVKFGMSKEEFVAFSKEKFHSDPVEDTINVSGLPPMTVYYLSENAEFNFGVDGKLGLITLSS